MGSFKSIFQSDNESSSIFVFNKHVWKKKQFWRLEAKLVKWKVRYQGAKRCPKIKALWEQLAERGIATNIYCSFTVSLPDEQFED